MLSLHATPPAPPLFLASEAAPDVNRLVMGALTFSDIEAVIAKDGLTQAAVQDIYNSGPVSPELASVLQMANQLGLSAAELRSLASLPGAQISSEIAPAMRRAAMQAAKNPVGLAAAAATIGGLIIYAENNPMPSPTAPVPQQPALPGFTPVDGRDITPPLTGLPAMDPTGPLVGTFPIADPLPPIIATPLPGPITPPNTGFGDGAEVPNGSVLLNEGNFGTHNGVPVTPGGKKIEDQIDERGWTPESIADTIAKGPTGKATDDRGAGKSNNTIKGEPATVYGYPGNYIIVNDRTGAIIQVSGRNNPAWNDDDRIIWDTNP